MKKKWIMIILIVMLVGYILILQISKPPELDCELITTMNISIQDEEFRQMNILPEEIPVICDKFNQLKKNFTGIGMGEKGWDIWINFSGDKQIYILGDTVTINGIVNRKYKVSKHDIDEFMHFLEAEILKGDIYEDEK